MGLFNKEKKKGGFMDQIRCDQPSYLIWKWHPAGAQEGETQRENAIRFGSSLRVKDGEVAVFVYKQNDETMQDFIVGPYDQMIKTANFPILSKIIGLAYEGGTPFQAEIYFINLANIIQVKFGVPFFDVYDPRFSDFGVPVSVRGTISFSIKDYRQFIKLHRLYTFTLEDFQKQIRDAVSRYIKNTVANAPSTHNIPVVQIENRTAQINDMVEEDIAQRLQKGFGVQVSGVDIASIELDKYSEGYRSLMSVTRDIAGATKQAEAAARIKDIADKQRIEAENYEESLRIQREEGQYAAHKSTQSANIGAFQIEKQAEVGVAGAEALGKMGTNGAGDVNLGGNGGDGFNMAAMMASMAVGGVVGQNIAGAMNTMMSGVQQPVGVGTPPPLPTVSYYVAVNGQSAGPFDLATLSQMIKAESFSLNTLVWKNGMPQWTKAEQIEELKALFLTTPVIPPIPSEEK